MDSPSKKQLVIAALSGIFGYALFSTLYFWAIEGLSITLAALLLYTYPFWVSVFSHFFTQDKISKEEGLCLLGALMGLLLLLWGHMEVKNFWAIFAGLGSAISYAIYVLVSGRVQKNVRPISSTLYVITFGAIALVLFHRPPLHEVTHLTQPQGFAVLGLAIICTIIPLTLELAALQKLKSATVAPADDDRARDGCDPRYVDLRRTSDTATDVRRLHCSRMLDYQHPPRQ